MIAIERLRYVRLGTRDLATSVNFAQQVLGLELASPHGSYRVLPL
jgi:catechol 2,3-dioxygenase-like lactoylglutathione lyase family enzyme